MGKDVWFDNVQVLHYNTQVLEENHYYPFGLTTSVNAMGMTAQPYKYQGIELEKKFGLETYETFYRGLNPQIGRWNGVDIKSDKYYFNSPYISMGNNPVSRVDPKGDSDYRIDSDGHLLLIRADDSKTDRLFYTNATYNKDGTLSSGEYSTLKKGIIRDKFVGKSSVKGYSLFFMNDDALAKEIYNNLKKWVRVEFSLISIYGLDGETRSMVSTSKNTSLELYGPNTMENELKKQIVANNTSLIQMEHVHPNGNNPEGDSWQDKHALKKLQEMIDGINEKLNRSEKNAIKVNSYFYEQRNESTQQVTQGDN